MVSLAIPFKRLKAFSNVLSAWVYLFNGVGIFASNCTPFSKRDICSLTYSFAHRKSSNFTSYSSCQFESAKRVFGKKTLICSCATCSLACILLPPASFTYANNAKLPSHSFFNCLQSAVSVFAGIVPLDVTSIICIIIIVFLSV